jgi:hypothetical protein
VQGRYLVGRFAEPFQCGRLALEAAPDEGEEFRVGGLRLQLFDHTQAA